MHLHHINIKGSWDLLARERDFFCEVLGLQEGYRPNFSSRGYWLYAGENAVVHLSESKSHISTGQEEHFDHVAFQSFGLSQLLKKLKNKEVKHSIVYLAEIDMSQIFCQSPSGAGIEINFLGEKI